MDEHQLHFLKAKGFDKIPGVFDCNVDLQTVTFEDGRTRQATEVWSRCMGYYRPIEAWNAGKQQEHRDREYFTSFDNA